MRYTGTLLTSIPAEEDWCTLKHIECGLNNSAGPETSTEWISGSDLFFFLDLLELMRDGFMETFSANDVNDIIRDTAGFIF